LAEKSAEDAVVAVDDWIRVRRQAGPGAGAAAASRRCSWPYLVGRSHSHNTSVFQKMPLHDSALKCLEKGREMLQLVRMT